MTLILGIETSCDETAAAVVRDGVHVLGERVASQVDLHARFGGVIPEVASRSHLEVLFPVVEDALEEAGVGLDALDALAVTTTPGLVGCLLVGLGAGKGLAIATGLPIVPVNHVHAHVYGALMPALQRGDTIAWPLAALVVSGGHTSLYACASPLELRLIGRTIDDAAGEAYDKVAAILGLGYPGGPVVDRLARRGRADAYSLPRTKVGTLDFSFSGIKTAVLHVARGHGAPRDAPLRADVEPADLAASFQAAVVDVLAERLLEAARAHGARGLVVCGGVAANSALRVRVEDEAARAGLPFHRPPLALATDNAVMIAGLGHHLLAAGRTAGLALDAAPRAD